MAGWTSNVKHWLHRQEKIPWKPEIISITVTSRCNLHCVTCHHAFGKVKKEDFNTALLEKTDDFLSSALLVDLTGLGEPLLSPVFWQILDRYPVTETTTDRDFQLNFNSNGTLLTRESIQKILNARVKIIRISMDAADPELFWKIRGAKLNEVVDGLQTLISERNKLRRRYPLIGVQMTLMRLNIQQVVPIIDLCSKIGVDFLDVWPLNELPEPMLKIWSVSQSGWSFNYRDELLSALPPDELKSVVNRFHEYAHQKCVPIASLIQGNPMCSEDFPRPEYADIPIEFNDNSIHCSMPWKELRIMSNGDVHVCCWGPKPVGNLQNDTIENIWNGKPIQETRTDLIAGRTPRLCQGAACPYLEGK
jgi:MoaA/NifB/PqqE/SkfB family radical SAM enzyme